jgi:co-chaperonin GroES (HSP10)
MIVLSDGYIIVKDIKQEQKAGLVKTNSAIHEDKFVAEVMYVSEASKYSVGDKIIYDGLQSEEFPKIDGITDDLSILKEKYILAIIK